MRDFIKGTKDSPLGLAAIIAAVLGVILTVVGGLFLAVCRKTVGKEEVGVMTNLSGKDLPPGQIFANRPEEKGLMVPVVRTPVSYINPFYNSMRVYPAVVIPPGKVGVRVKLYGQDPPPGEIMAKNDSQKGIVPEPLIPGRYPLNALVIDGVTRVPIDDSRAERRDYVEIVEIWDPVTIPAGFGAVITSLTGEISPEANTLLVKEGFRGTLEKIVGEGIYQRNPYQLRFDPIDLRSQRLAFNKETNLALITKDGFRITLEGVIEWRIIPEKAPELFVLYNELANDTRFVSSVEDELVKKIILPNVFSYFAQQGTNATVVSLVDGQGRAMFEKGFQTALQEACRLQGIEIVQALLTKIDPPSAITTPLKEREIARQQESQFKAQKERELEASRLAEQEALVTQGATLVENEKGIAEKTTKALQDQLTAMEKANQGAEVAEKRLQAAKDEAAAIVAKGRAEADVVRFQNLAEAAKWKSAVKAFGSGRAFSENALGQKLSKAYDKIVANSGDDKSPLLRFFQKPEPEAGDKPAEGSR